VTLRSLTRTDPSCHPHPRLLCRQRTHAGAASEADMTRRQSLQVSRGRRASRLTVMFVSCLLTAGTLSASTAINPAAAAPTMSWTLTPSPNPYGAVDVSTGISCISTSSCMAVGRYYYGGPYSTLAELWNGTTARWKRSMAMPSSSMGRSSDSEPSA